MHPVFPDVIYGNREAAAAWLPLHVQIYCGGWPGDSVRADGLKSPEGRREKDFSTKGRNLSTKF